MKNFLLIGFGFLFGTSLLAYPTRFSGTFFRPCNQPQWSSGLIRINDSLCIHPYHVDSTFWDGEPVLIYIEKDSMQIIPKYGKRDSVKLDNHTFVISRDARVQKQLYKDANYLQGWLQVILTIFTFLVSYFVWRLYYKQFFLDCRYERTSEDEIVSKDLGIFYLYGALFFWALNGLARVYLDHCGCLELISAYSSILNNLFFLMSFPYFNHGIAFFKRKNSTYQILTLGIFIVSSIFVTIGFCFNIPNLYKFTDFIFSFGALSFLVYLMYQSFKVRRPYGISILSLIWWFFTILSQAFMFCPWLRAPFGIWANIIYLSCFIALNVFLVALIFNWYTERQEEEQKDYANMITEFVVDSKKSSDLSFLKLCKVLILKGNIPFLFKVLETKGLSKSNDFKNELTTLQAQYVDARSTYVFGRIDRDKYLIELNKIREAIQYFIEKHFN